MNEKSQIESVIAIKILKEGMCCGLTFEIKIVHFKLAGMNVLAFLSWDGRGRKVSSFFLCAR